MTVELTEKTADQNLPVPNRDEFIQTANLVLMPNERDELFAYIKLGGRQAPASVNQPFFELFHNGCFPEEIHALNPSYHTQAIQWMRIAYKWDETLQQTVMRNNALLVGKINKAQVDAAMLMSDMIAVATKKNQERLRKYLQTGDETNLVGIMTLDSPERLGKMVESLIKLVYREEQTMSIKIPVSKLPQATQKHVQTIATTATNLIADVAAAKREKARAKVLSQDTVVDVETGEE